MFGPKVAKAGTKAAETPGSVLTPPRSTLPGRHGPEGGAPDNTMAQKRSAGVAWDFSAIPLYPPDQAIRSRGSSPIVIQRRPVIGHAKDPLEHEADGIADQVMRMTGPTLSLTADSSHVSRNAATGEEENAKPLQATQPAAREVDAHMASELRARHGSGSPLP